MLRDAADADSSFLRRLYLDAHPEFAALPPGQLDAIVDLQLTAQRSQYERDHPSARDRIIEVAAEPVGRCWTAETPEEIRLLDLAVVAAARGRGVATAVLGELCGHASASGRTVRLAVWTGNLAARRLYERAGFRPEGEDGGYLALRWG